jgi:hypothetical protein
VKGLLLGPVTVLPVCDEERIMKISWIYKSGQWKHNEFHTYTPLRVITYYLRPVDEILAKTGLTASQEAHAQLNFEDPDERSDYRADCIAGEDPGTPEPEEGTILLLTFDEYSMKIEVNPEGEDYGVRTDVG